MGISRAPLAPRSVAPDLPPASDAALTAFDDGLSPALVGRNCKLQAYSKYKVPTFEIQSNFTAYASPDSTFDLTRMFVDSARKSILVGIYDFTADYVKDLFLRAMQRRVAFGLMLDLDGRTGEQGIFDELEKFGADASPAPSCASDSAQYFASSHEKVTVIDGNLTLVQSGNFSDNSIPPNGNDTPGTHGFMPGNRDMGVAVQSKALAVFFDKVLRGDMALERAGAGVSGLIPVAAPEADLVAAAPYKLPPLVAWKTFTPTRLVSVIPVLSPDNYMDVVPGSARQRHQIDRHRTAVHPRHSTRSCQATRGDPRRSLPQQEA